VSVSVERLGSSDTQVCFIGHTRSGDSAVLFNPSNRIQDDSSMAYAACFSRSLAGDMDVSVHRFSIKDLVPSPWALKITHALSGTPRLYVDIVSGVVCLAVAEPPDGPFISVVVNAGSNADIGLLKVDSRFDTARYEPYTGGVSIVPVPCSKYPFFSLMSELVADSNTVVDADEEI